VNELSAPARGEPEECGSERRTRKDASRKNAREEREKKVQSLLRKWEDMKRAGCFRLRS